MKIWIFSIKLVSHSLLSSLSKTIDSIVVLLLLWNCENPATNGKYSECVRFHSDLFSPETSRISPVSAPPSLVTSYGFNIPKFQSQKIPESTPKVSVGRKKFLCKTNNFGLKTWNSGFQKHEVSGRINEVSVRKTRSFGSKILKFRFENPKFWPENPKFRYENPKFRFRTPKFQVQFLNSKLLWKLSSGMLR
jgi:hypothetical protein